MNTDLLLTIEKPHLKKMPKFEVGDTVAVDTIVREGDKKRVQVFKGIVIAIKGSGARKTFTVRKISSGIGVEKILPIYSPNIDKIEVLKKGKVRKSKIYYMRKRIGKKALKIAEGEMYGDEYMVSGVDYEAEEKAEADAKAAEEKAAADAKAKEEAEAKAESEAKAEENASEKEATKEEKA